MKWRTLFYPHSALELDKENTNHPAQLDQEGSRTHYALAVPDRQFSAWKQCVFSLGSEAGSEKPIYDVCCWNFASQENWQYIMYLYKVHFILNAVASTKA